MSNKIIYHLVRIIASEKYPNKALRPKYLVWQSLLNRAKLS